MAHTYLRYHHGYVDLLAHCRRCEAELAKVAGARATTCDEAMPTVDLILEATR